MQSYPIWWKKRTFHFSIWTRTNWPISCRFETINSFVMCYRQTTSSTPSAAKATSRPWSTTWTGSRIWSTRRRSGCSMKCAKRPMSPEGPNASNTSSQCRYTWRTWKTTTQCSPSLAASTLVPCGVWRRRGNWCHRKWWISFARWRPWWTPRGTCPSIAAWRPRMRGRHWCPLCPLSKKTWLFCTWAMILKWMDWSISRRCAWLRGRFVQCGSTANPPISSTHTGQL